VIIDGKVFIVTGGGSGLGAATAGALAAAGGRVVLADLDAEAGAKRAAKIGDAARFLLTDVANEDDGRAAVRLALDAFGHLHGLVNCAGVATSEKVLSGKGPHRLETFNRALTVNLIGTFNMLRLVAEAIAREAPGEDGERGVIINTASIAAFEGQIGQAAYAASKAGVIGLTLPVARELAEIGVRVVAIAPGVFETPMVGGMKPELKEQLSRVALFPSRLGRPAEFAALVRHVVENVMLNGEVIRLDGAGRMGSH
jgi:NAD(P)-dependent dehydrogenase (short-subunit alcohol dehydrogenase family)